MSMNIVSFNYIFPKVDPGPQQHLRWRPLCAPHLPFLLGVKPSTKFSKGRKGGLDRISVFRGDFGKEGGDFFRGSCSFYIKIN